MKKSINKIINKIVGVKKRRKIRKTLEKGKKEEKKMEILKEEIKKPNILLGLFKKEITKKEEKIPVVKKEEKKISFRKANIEKKELGIISYFILFLLSIIIFFVSCFYKNILFMIFALILISLSLFAYKKLKTKKAEEVGKKEKGEVKEEIKEKIKEKKPNIFSRLLSKIKIKKEHREEIKKEEKKPEEKPKEKIPIVKELPSSLKIELGKYETNIDALYKIIEKEGRIKLSAISKYFGIDKRKAEEWATILQEHNLAEIHYPAIGEPELKKCQK